MRSLVFTLAALFLCGAAYAQTPAKAKAKQSASAGTSTAPGATGIDLEQAFKHADIDGDGAVSKAEAAGNERLVKGFDRADKDHDGKLSREEFDSLYKGKPRAADRAAAK